MTEAIISAIFEDESAAGLAIARLRGAGFHDESIAVVRRDSSSGYDDDLEEPDNKGSGALKGMGVGAGVGALFGLSALVIPGVGPIIAAGAFVETLGIIGSGAASGAVVGGTAGGIAGALMKYGVSEEDASFYGDRIESGEIWIAVDTRRTAMNGDIAADILDAAGGTSTSRGRRREVASI